MTPSAPLPPLIWVAAKPPMPPFAGGMLKTHCGIRSLADLTAITLVTFAPQGESESIRASLAAFWHDTPLNIQVVEYAPNPPIYDALRQNRFQFGLRVERSALSPLLDTLIAQSPDSLLVFDDIIFAPLMPRYGPRAILSPHDCISKMLGSHLRYASSAAAKIRIWTQRRIALAYEQQFYHQALLLHLVTHRDRLWLENINRRAVYHTLPYADQTGLAIAPPDTARYDILVWSDLRIAPIAQGTRAFLAAHHAAAAPGGAKALRVLVVGKVARAQAESILGGPLLNGVDYAPYLEDECGTIQTGKIIVIPDFGGAGIKSRCLSVLKAGSCLACLYEQMQGIETLCDTGVINARDMTLLVSRVHRALADDSYVSIARRGGEMYTRQFGDAVLRGLWAEMIERTAAIAAAS